MVNVHQSASCALVRPDSLRCAAIQQLAACRAVGGEKSAVVNQLRQGEGLNSTGCSTKLARDPVAGYAARGLEQASSGVCGRSRRAYRPQAIRLSRPIHTFDQQTVRLASAHVGRSDPARSRPTTDGIQSRAIQGRPRPLEATRTLTIGDLRNAWQASRWRNSHIHAPDRQAQPQPDENKLGARRIAMHIHLGGLDESAEHTARPANDDETGTGCRE